MGNQLAGGGEGVGEFIGIFAAGLGFIGLAAAAAAGDFGDGANEFACVQAFGLRGGAGVQDKGCFAVRCGGEQDDAVGSLFAQAFDQGAQGVGG